MAEAGIQTGGTGAERTGTKQLLGLFDRVEQQLGSEAEPRRAHESLEELFVTLMREKLARNAEDWQRFVESCRRHPLFDRMQEDPFTRRAFEKPRGYAGDACMMDFIYGVEDGRPNPATTTTGKLVFDYVTGIPACQGVRSRRAVVAACIDRLASARARPHVLSIAAGHLREAELSVAIRRKQLGRLLALDADAESLAEVQRAYGRLGVETRAASFLELFVDAPEAERFDLVYSTGLFDYVAPRTGRRLVRAMHQRVRPGGSLLIANFLPGIRDAGYMEAFMDWELVYRSRKEMVELTADIAESEVKSVELWSEEALNIIFLRVTRH